MADAYEKIRADVEQKFPALLQDVFASNLAAVILYGSAAAGTYRTGVSDINILILLEKDDPAALFRLGRQAGALVRRLRMNPLVMSVAEFSASADVFPMEYSDIRACHRLLFGRDEVSGLQLVATNLRHQSEERLRGAVNDLRRLILASSGRLGVLARALSEWSGAQNTLFRSLLRLKAVADIPTGAGELRALVGREYGADVGIFSEVAAAGAASRDRAASLETATRLLSALSALAEAVNKMPG